MGQKNTDGGNIFRFMKLEESMAGEDSKPEKKCSELAGIHFMIGKIKFRWKFWSSKGLESDLSQNSAEFQMDFPTKLHDDLLRKIGMLSQKCVEYKRIIKRLKMDLRLSKFHVRQKKTSDKN